MQPPKHPQNEYQEFPRMLYNETGTKIVATEEELEAALEDGYVKSPAEVGVKVERKPPTPTKKTATLKRKED
ncbi:MAG: hypothetical protein MJH10_11025 [Epibacterium sp.]|nr:hypothetical protein [Epibacterium sp.]NQX74078.1 hypothetical protein [Epibacterium sp.]